MQSVGGLWSLPDSIRGCAVTYSPSRFVVGPKCDGLYVPLIPLQREITWDGEYQADIHGHAFANVQESRSRSLWSSWASLSSAADQYVIAAEPNQSEILKTRLLITYLQQ